MVTKDEALVARFFEHVELKNADGSAVRCRATGKCKTWKTRPDEFKLPVKYGLYHSFYINEENAYCWVAVS